MSQLDESGLPAEDDRLGDPGRLCPPRWTPGRVPAATDATGNAVPDGETLTGETLTDEPPADEPLAGAAPADEALTDEPPADEPPAERRRPTRP